MKTTFTDRLIRGLVAEPGKRIEITDAACPGLALRVTDKGVKTFSFFTWFKSKPVRVTLGRYPELSLVEARRRADIERVKVRDGIAPRPVKAAHPAGGITFDEAADRYLEWAKRQKSSWYIDKSLLKRPRAKWGRLPIAAITDQDAAQLLDETVIEAPTGVNRMQSVLSKMFRWARDPARKYVIANPLTGIERRGIERVGDRVLTDDEIRKLWHGLDRTPGIERPVALTIKMMLATMQRPGEVTGMTRDEIDGDLWTIPPLRVKNRRFTKARGHIVPLSRLAMSIVEEATAGHDLPCVFKSRLQRCANMVRNTPSQAIKNNIDKLGIAHFVPRDLRRTAASIARRAGARRDDVKALLNHRQDDITAVYDRYDMLDEKREVAAVLAREIERIIGASKPDRVAKPKPPARTTRSARGRSAPAVETLAL